MKRHMRLLASMLAALFLVCAVGAFAVSKTANRGREKQAERAAAKADRTRNSNLTAPASGRATLAYPSNIRFYTVSPNFSDIGHLLREVDPSSEPAAVLDEIEMTIEGNAIFGASALAVDPINGDMYIIVRTSDSDFAASFLGIVDTATGEIEVIAEMDNIIAELAFDADGTLYGISADQQGFDNEVDPDTLYEIDKSDGSLDELDSFDSRGDDGEVITIDPVTGNFFHFSGGIIERGTPGGTFTEINDDSFEMTGGVYVGDDQFLIASFDEFYMVDTDGNTTFVSAFDDDGCDTCMSGLAFTGSLVNEVNGGQEADFTLVIPDTEDTNGETYTFECTDGLPDGAVCEFTPDEVTITEGAESTTLTVHTGGNASLFPSSLRGTFALWLMLPGVAVVGLVLGRKNARVRNSMLMLLLLSLVLLMPACGGEDNRFGGGVDPGLHLITVTATSAGDTQTFQVALQVN